VNDRETKHATITVDDSQAVRIYGHVHGRVGPTGATVNAEIDYGTGQNVQRVHIGWNGSAGSRERVSFTESEISALKVVLRTLLEELDEHPLRREGETEKKTRRRFWDVDSEEKEGE
jgi:hypothetical protein